MELPYREEMLDQTKRLNAPFYFYDLNGLRDHINMMAAECPEGVKLWYACKANPLSSVLKVFRNEKFGVDIASQGELKQVLSCAIKPQNILATGPAKSLDYLKNLLLNDVEVIVAESINQLYWLNQVALIQGKRPRVLLRVQLDWDKEESSVLGGSSITPFGLSIDDWKKCDFKELGQLDIEGVHVFQWGNILDDQKLLSIWTEIAKKGKEVEIEFGLTFKTLDLGGGLGIPYSSNQKDLNFKNIASHLENIRDEFSYQNIWMEIGRYAVGSFGKYVNRIVDQKEVRGKNILVLEGGINHMARPALTNQYFPVSALNESDAELIEWRLHGPLCTALDFLGEFSLPSDLKIGDWVVFHQSGAYGFTESMPYFLCHNQAAEVVHYQDDTMIPRGPKNPDHWME